MIVHELVEQERPCSADEYAAYELDCFQHVEGCVRRRRRLDCFVVSRHVDNDINEFWDMLYQGMMFAEYLGRPVILKDETVRCSYIYTTLLSGLDSGEQRRAVTPSRVLKPMYCIPSWNPSGLDFELVFSTFVRLDLARIDCIGLGSNT